MNKSGSNLSAYFSLVSIGRAGLSFAATILTGVRTVFPSLGSPHSRRAPSLIALCAVGFLFAPVGAQDSPKEIALSLINSASAGTVSAEKTAEKSKGQWSH